MWARDIKRLQSWAERCYRYICGNRNRQPLREMQDGHSNMEDVRTRLGVNMKIFPKGVNMKIFPETENIS